MVYDVGLYAMFVNMKLHQDEKDTPAHQAANSDRNGAQRLEDEEELASLRSFGTDSETASDDGDGLRKSVKTGI